MLPVELVRARAVRPRVQAVELLHPVAELREELLPRQSHSVADLSLSMPPNLARVKWILETQRRALPQAMLLQSVKPLPAEAVRMLRDLVARPPQASPKHSQSMRKKWLPAMLPRELASLQAEPLAELTSVQQAPVAPRELPRVAAAPEPLALALRRWEAYAEFSFSPLPFAAKATVERRDVPSAAESEPRAAAPVPHRDPPR